MSASYPVPAETRRHEVVIEKSRFIADVAPAPDLESAKTFIQRIREEFPDATHHCFAFIAGRPNDSQVMGSSDDGEPGGTAGKPMLTVLSHSGIGDVVAVVTRYYGGIKLGTGGLARAYGGTLAQNLNELVTREKVHYRHCRTACDYAQLATVEHSLAEAGGQILRSDYGAEVALNLAVPSTSYEAFVIAVRNRTRDSVVLHAED